MGRYDTSGFEALTDTPSASLRAALCGEGIHVWTASCLQGLAADFASGRLRPCVRPVGAAVRPLAKLVSATRVPNRAAASKRHWIARSAPRRGSPDPSICSLSRKPGSAGRAGWAPASRRSRHAAAIVGCARAMLHVSPLAISFQAMRAILLASAIAASFGGLRPPLSGLLASAQATRRSLGPSRTPLDQAFSSPAWLRR